MVQRVFAWVLAALLLPVVATADGSGPTFWMPDQASTISTGIDRVFYIIYWISAAFFVGIVVAMVMFALAYRRKRAGQPAKSQTDHNMAIEAIWTIVPLGLAIYIFYIGFAGFMDFRTVPANAYEVNVEGQQWNWSFTYPNGYVTNELHVPVDRPIRLTMTSVDVLHSFFVPEFRIKYDVLPGKYTTAWFHATKSGEYNVFCTEYCGTSHSQMRTKVVVHDPGMFQPWLDAASNWIDTMSPVEAGQRVYQVRGCTQCHSIDGSSGIGPSFKGIWGRTEQMKSGEQVVVDENYVRESVLEPQAKIVAGYDGVMPTYQGRLKEDEIRVLIAYLKSLSGEGS